MLLPQKLVQQGIANKRATKAALGLLFALAVLAVVCINLNASDECVEPLMLFAAVDSPEPHTIHCVTRSGTISLELQGLSPKPSPNNEDFLYIQSLEEDVWELVLGNAGSFSSQIIAAGQGYVAYDWADEETIVIATWPYRPSLSGSDYPSLELYNLKTEDRLAPPLKASFVMSSQNGDVLIFVNDEGLFQLIVGDSGEVEVNEIATQKPVWLDNVSVSLDNDLMVYSTPCDEEPASPMCLFAQTFDGSEGFWIVKPGESDYSAVSPQLSPTSRYVAFSFGHSLHGIGIYDVERQNPVFRDTDHDIGLPPRFVPLAKLDSMAPERVMTPV
jgi:hypothetical protein